MYLLENMIRNSEQLFVCYMHKEFLFLMDYMFASDSDVLDKMHKKYGGVVKLWLAPTQLLVSVEEMDLIKEVLLKAEDKLPLTGRAFRLAFGRSSLFISSFHKVCYVLDVFQVATQHIF